MSSLFVIQWGTIKINPLSPLCAALWELLNVIHCQLICDQIYIGFGKLEGTVLCFCGRRCAIQYNCLLSNCPSTKGALKEVSLWVFPTEWSTNYPKQMTIGVFNSVFWSLSLISGSVFVGFTSGIAAFYLNYFHAHVPAGIVNSLNEPM